MKDWFESLESREKLTLVIGAVILGLALTWVLLIDPLYSSAGNRLSRIVNLQEDVSRARQLRSEIKQLKESGGARSSSDQSMIITLERTARESGLQVNTSRPMDATTVRVSFEAAPFQALVNWMAVLERQHGIRVDIASLDRLDVPGMVDAQLTVKRPG